MKNEVMSVVCGAMFGEERVNNFVDLFPGHCIWSPFQLVKFQRWLL